MGTPPSGTVTFLFTDIEGSTRLWEQHSEAMRRAIATHDRTMSSAIEANAGYVFSTAGDAFAAAFPKPGLAIEAAIEAQRELTTIDWGPTEIRVRMGIHTGDAEERDGDYFGPALNRGARVMATAHGQQMVVSAATAQLVRPTLAAGVSLRDLGEHQLKDLSEPEHLYQITVAGLRTEFPPLRSIDASPTNLPVQLSPFVGREDQLIELAAMLDDNQLVALIGAGGVGKTRLAIQVGADILDSSPDGVWFVDLSVLESAELVPKQLALAVGIQEQADRSMADTVVDALAGLRALLILDNCEHVLAGVAPLVERILRRSPSIRVLATSREALGVAGELVWDVPPMALPVDPEDVDALERNESIRLFVDRAARADRSFVLDASNAAACAAICRQLDGMPLAIELAAARLGALSPQQVLDHLDDHLAILTRGPRTAVARQQTLRATIDWSYQLLPEREQGLLRALSVFRGGFTLEAVAALSAADGAVALDLLTRLVEQSLVVADRESGLRRFRLLETIRQYAWERLAAAGEEEMMLARHRDYFVEWAETQGHLVSGPGQLEALRALDAEHDNMRAVLERSISTDDPEPALRVAAALSTYWWLHSHFGESGAWYHRLLGARQQVSSRIRAKLLIGAGQFSMAVSEHVEADMRLQEALQIARRVGSARLEGWSLAYLMSNEAWRMDMAAAGRYAEESLAVFGAIEDPLGVGYVTFLRIALDAGARRRDGTLTAREAEAYVETVEGMLGAARVFGERNLIAHLLDLIGLAAVVAQDYAKAGKRLAEAVSTFEVVGNQQCLAHSLESVATMAAARGRYVEAIQLSGAIHALRRHIGVAPRALERAASDGAMEESRQHLTPADFDAAWADGEAMPADQAADFALTIVEATRQQEAGPLKARTQTGDESGRSA